ncbi:hypothetical protein C8R45DRAFT_1162860 [Mycena sanguinolenta]|nr:hypothetical protein C8R45DRAFT_1162860 [Mycena sanguinolenta]
MVTVEIHSLESLRVPAAWPAQISRTCDLLEVPLPSWCSNRHYNVLSNVPKLSSFWSTHDPSEDLFKNPSLRDFYELASHTVGALRGLSSHAPFVRARIISPDNTFDGIAEMLACHVVQGFWGTDDSLMLDDEKSSASEAASFARSHSNTISSRKSHSGATSNRENHPNGTSTRDSNSAERSPRGSVSRDIGEMWREKQIGTHPVRKLTGAKKSKQWKRKQMRADEMKSEPKSSQNARWKYWTSSWECTESSSSMNQINSGGTTPWEELNQNSPRVEKGAEIKGIQQHKSDAYLLTEPARSK